MITSKLQFLLGKDTIAITIFPFIIIRKEYKDDPVIINHERIHIKQQVELSPIIFFVWYFIEYFIKYIKYKNSYVAYKNISFEKESYENQYDRDYLKKRKLYSFFKYL